MGIRAIEGDFSKCLQVLFGATSDAKHTSALNSKDADVSIVYVFHFK